MQGYGPTQIAKEFSKRRIMNPTAHAKANGINIPDNRGHDDNYIWRGSTIAHMLSRQEYLGHTVNFKTYRKSYKQKKQMKNDPLEWLVFENTHKAIIEEPVFEVVQKIRDGRRRLTPMGEMPILSGMLLCADCGAKLYQVRHRGWEHDKEHFVCATYRKIKGGCSSHQIRNVVVEELLLDGIRRVTAYARDHEDEFVEMVTKKTRIDLVAEDFLDCHIVPKVIAANTRILLALFLIVIIEGRQDMLFVQLCGNFSVAPALAPIGKYLLHHPGGIFVNDEFVLVIGMRLIAIRYKPAKVISHFGVSLLDRLDFLAGVLALELVEQIPERHNVVVIVDGIHTVIQGDKTASDHRKHIIRKLPHLNVVPSEAAQILDENQVNKTLFGILNELGYAGTVKGCAADSIVTINGIIVPALFLTVSGEHQFLVFNTDGFSRPFIILAQTDVDADLVIFLDF
jgi:hypothetical protein